MFLKLYAKFCSLESKYNSKTDRVIRDRYEKLALEKVMRNGKERQYVDKDDSMTDMTDLNK